MGELTVLPQTPLLVLRGPLFAAGRGWKGEGMGRGKGGEEKGKKGEGQRGRL